MQRSKAKNFRDQVERWAQRTSEWVEEFGTLQLLRNLKLQGPSKASPSRLRLVAIGRSNARFRSYGYAVSVPGVLCIPWPQLVRLRHEIGSTDNAFAELERRAQLETACRVLRSPLPHVLELHDCKVTLPTYGVSFWSSRLRARACQRALLQARIEPSVISSVFSPI